MQRNATIVQNAATAVAEAERLGAVSTRLLNIQNSTAWTDHEVLRYLWTQQLRNSDVVADATLAVGFEQ